jgi:hypothetical protein
MSLIQNIAKDSVATVAYCEEEEAAEAAEG